MQLHACCGSKLALGLSTKSRYPSKYKISTSLSCEYHHMERSGSDMINELR